MHGVCLSMTFAMLITKFAGLNLDTNCKLCNLALIISYFQKLNKKTQTAS